MFLGNPTLAMVTVCVFKIWISYPFMMMMCAAALESVETSIYEASEIDGANRWQQFFYIVLPVTARSTYISWILMAVFCVNDFPTIYLLTRGGPLKATTSLVVLAYKTDLPRLPAGQRHRDRILHDGGDDRALRRAAAPDPKVEPRNDRALDAQAQSVQHAQAVADDRSVTAIDHGDSCCHQFWWSSGWRSDRRCPGSRSDRPWAPSGTC